jgi:2-polyprenyl-3-methyl-5-hydroxy-6-metoxy-1,4-benzoquinol methylase
MNMTTRSYEKELLDADDIPFSDMLQILKELNVINTRLGGHRITRLGVDFFTRDFVAPSSITIAEIGCGGGDNLNAIVSYMAKKGCKVKIIGIDLKEECIQYARQNADETATLICSDYRTVAWPDGLPDIIFSSLFCHHFTDVQLKEQLGWLQANSKLGFFINDLHRHPIAYYSIMALTRLFSRSPIVKNDGPLSVRRAFIKEDWVKLLFDSGIKKHSIKWHWAFRYLICVHNEK